MRVLIALPCLLLLGAAPLAPPKLEQTKVVSPQPAHCKPLGGIAKGGDDAKMHRLGELPPGKAYMAVYRTDARGCIDPMLASERQGSRPAR